MSSPSQSQSNTSPSGPSSGGTQTPSGRSTPIPKPPDIRKYKPPSLPPWLLRLQPTQTTQGTTSPASTSTPPVTPNTGSNRKAGNRATSTSSSEQLQGGTPALSGRSISESTPTDVHPPMPLLPTPQSQPTQASQGQEDEIISLHSSSGSDDDYQYYTAHTCIDPLAGSPETSTSSSQQLQDGQSSSQNYAQVFDFGTFIPAKEIYGFDDLKDFENNAITFQVGQVKRVDFVVKFRHDQEEPLQMVATLLKKLQEIKFKNKKLEDKTFQVQTFKVDQKVSVLLIYVPKVVLHAYAEKLALRVPLKLEYESNYPHDHLYRETSAKMYVPFKQGQQEHYDLLNYPFTSVQRAYVIDNALKSLYYSERIDRGQGRQFSYSSLMTKKIILGAYLPHEETKVTDLSELWATANIFKYLANIRDYNQPLAELKDYFGGRVAIYFMWLGYYWQNMFYPVIFALATLAYGCFTVDSHEPVIEVCRGVYDNFYRCPLGYKEDFTLFSEMCDDYKSSYKSVNRMSIVFGLFVCIWVGWLLQHWKVYVGRFTVAWDLPHQKVLSDPARVGFLERYRNCPNRIHNPVNDVSEPVVGLSDRWLHHATGYTVYLCLVLSMIVLYTLSINAFLNLVADKLGNIFEGLVANICLMAIVIFICSIFKSCLASLIARVTTVILCPRTQTEFTTLQAALYIIPCLILDISYFGCIALVVSFIQNNPADHWNDLYILFPLLQKRYVFKNCKDDSCLTTIYTDFRNWLFAERFLALLLEFIYTFSKCDIGQFITDYIVFGVRKLIKVVYRKLRKKNEPQRATRWPPLPPQPIRQTPPSPPPQNFWQQIVQMVKKFQPGYQRSPYPAWYADFSKAPFDDSPLMVTRYLEFFSAHTLLTLFVAFSPLGFLFVWIINGFLLRLQAIRITQNCQRQIPKRAISLQFWNHVARIVHQVSLLTNGLMIAIHTDIVPQLAYYSKHQTLAGYFNKTQSFYDIDRIYHFMAEHNFTGKPKNETGYYCIYGSQMNPPWAGEKAHSEFKLSYWQMLSYRLAFILFFLLASFSLSAICGVIVKSLFGDVSRLWTGPDIEAAATGQNQQQPPLISRFLSVFQSAKEFIRNALPGQRAQNDEMELKELNEVSSPPSCYETTAVIFTGREYGPI